MLRVVPLTEVHRARPSSPLQEHYAAWNLHGPLRTGSKVCHVPCAYCCHAGALETRGHLSRNSTNNLPKFKFATAYSKLLWLDLREMLLGKRSPFYNSMELFEPIYRTLSVCAHVCLWTEENWEGNLRTAVLVMWSDEWVVRRLFCDCETDFWTEQSESKSGAT